MLQKASVTVQTHCSDHFNYTKNKTKTFIFKMFKLLALACILASAYAAPGIIAGPAIVHGVHAAPAVVHAPILHAPAAVAVHAAPAPIAVSHSSSHVVHSAPVVKTIVAAHHVPAVAVAHSPVLLHHH